MSNLLCKFIGYKTSLCLNNKPSLLGAASILVTINILKSEILAPLLSLNQLKIIEFQESGPLEIWNDKIENLTKISRK